MSDLSELRVLIVSEHASFRFGGEAVLPAHYFKGLRARGVECWLITHERTRRELEEAFAAEQGRITYVPDTWLVKMLYHLGRPLGDRLNYFTFGAALRVLNQLTARKMARRLVAEKRINVVHQPIPVSPKEPTLLRKLGAPLIIGPMNGGMSYPPDFRDYDSRLMRAFQGGARFLTPLFHWLLPGKREAALLLVANARTRAALPKGVGPVRSLVENGVDLGLWREVENRSGLEEETPPLFLFAGRLLRLKGVDILLDAAAAARKVAALRLVIVGDGTLRAELEAQAKALQLAEVVTFAGWVTQRALAERMAACDVFVLPSLHECGGAVVLEAMACGKPTIAVNWGGPGDYLDAATGILIQPSRRERLVQELAGAMMELAKDPARRQELGRAARAKVEREYSWDEKIDRMIEIYAEVARGRNGREARFEA
jgi:glycosyltransferase involved in cell wall biosynthesis